MKKILFTDDFYPYKVTRTFNGYTEDVEFQYTLLFTPHMNEYIKDDVVVYKTTGIEIDSEEFKNFWLHEDLEHELCNLKYTFENDYTNEIVQIKYDFLTEFDEYIFFVIVIMEFDMKDDATLDFDSCRYVDIEVKQQNYMNEAPSLWCSLEIDNPVRNWIVNKINRSGYDYLLKNRLNFDIKEYN